MFKHVKLDREVPKLQQLNENGTRYYVTPEGNKYPSITTVLAAYNIGYIMEWRKRVGEEVANKISQKASGRGTRIHTLCEQYIDNRKPECKSPLDQELFNKFKPTLHRINNVHAQEIRMYSDHLRIAGTVDCVAEFDGVLSVIDFKTSKRLKNKEDIENYFMQCSAYAEMFGEITGKPIDQLVVAIAVEEASPQIFVRSKAPYIRQLEQYINKYHLTNTVN